MAEIHRKQSIIKRRESTFHAKPKKVSTFEKIRQTVAKPAAFIHKQATSERGKKVISGVGSFLSSWGESARAAQERQYGATKKRKSSKKRKTTKRRR